MDDPYVERRKVDRHADAEKERLLAGVGAVVGVITVFSLLVILGAFCCSFSAPSEWTTPIAVLLAVATAGHWPVEWLARLVGKVGRDLKPDSHVAGFENPGAYLGMVERPLFLGALVAGYPQFIALWIAYKGIAGYRVSEQNLTLARRQFQLFLLNSAVSFAMVALGWLVWHQLDLPVWQPTGEPVRTP
jgi:hypothetical protein